MKSFMDHVKKTCIELVEKTSGLMINDTKSFVFLRSEGIKALKKHSLGGGNLLVVIGQFAVLNFLAKVYFIALKGEGGYITEDDIKEYEEKASKVKEDCPEAWRLLKKYCHKPRLWDIESETDAFVRLIRDYPKDIGISKERDSIVKVWRDFRNKTSHIATIANGNTSLTFEFEKGTTFEQAKKLLTKSRQKSFFIRSQEEKTKLRRQIIAENNEKGVPTSGEVIARATSDQVRPDLLGNDVQKIMEWLVEKIKNDEFEEENLKFLEDWLFMQHYVNK